MEKMTAELHDELKYELRSDAPRDFRYDEPLCKMCDGLGHTTICPLEETGEINVPRWAR